VLLQKGFASYLAGTAATAFARIPMLLPTATLGNLPLENLGSVIRPVRSARNKIDAYASGTTQLILDVSSYFALITPSSTTNLLRSGIVQTPYSASLQATDSPYKRSAFHQQVVSAPSKALSTIITSSSR
jgi:hypothetical protein